MRRVALWGFFFIALLLFLSQVIRAALLLGQRTASGPALATTLAPATRLPATALPALSALPADHPPTRAPSAPPARPTALPAPTPPPLSARYAVQPGDRVTLVRPGVIHIRRTTADPLRINLLLFDLTKPQFSLRPAVGDGWLSGRQRTSFMAEQQGALAAVNGDLFAENGVPQGLMIADAQIYMAPKHRATFAWSRRGEPWIGYFTDEWTWVAEVIAPSGARRPLYLLNTPCVPDGICLFNQFARTVPARSGDLKVIVGRDGRVRDLVRGAQVRVPAGAQVLQGVGKGAAWLDQHLATGERVRLDMRTDPPLGDVAQAISGGPIILRDGEFVQDCMCALRDCSLTARPRARLLCEDFTSDWKNRHYLWVQMPRTGIGFDRARQTLIVAVVDGYQRGYSRGITQAAFADLMREFGADTAMELDGGGSTTMVLEDRVVNRPSDESGERYVANALLFFWDDDRRDYRP